MDPTVQISIDATGLAEAAGSLEARIRTRFPSSSLLANASWLRVLVSRAREERRAYHRRFLAVRFLCALLVLLGGSALGFGVYRLSLDFSVKTFVELSQAVESAVNDIIFLALGSYFLFRFEPWLKRRRMLRFLGKLRDLVHVTQILQMHKDPERILRPAERSTNASPTLGDMGANAFLMNTYLDYCLDMLCLLSAIAAYVGRDVTDRQLRDAVWQMEELCGSVSNKISNKTLMLFAALLEEGKGRSSNTHRTV